MIAHNYVYGAVMLLERNVEIGARPPGRWADEIERVPSTELDDGAFQVSRRPTLFAADEEIPALSSGAPNLFQVIFGVTRICTVLNDGRRTISAFHFPGEIFGFEPAGKRGFRAEAVEAVGVRMLAVPPEGHDTGELLRLALASLAVAQEHLIVVGRQTAGERIASFLLDVARRQSYPEVIDLPMPRVDIADYLGLTPETVCRVFKLLQERGLIDFVSPRRAVIKSVEALDRLIA